MQLFQMSPYAPEYEFPKSVIETPGSEILSKTLCLLWGSRIVRFKSLGKGSLYQFLHSGGLFC